MRWRSCGAGGFSGAIAAATRTGNGSKACCVSSPYFLLVSFTPKCNETTTPRNRMRSLRSSGSVGGVVRPSAGRPYPGSNPQHRWGLDTKVPPLTSTRRIFSRPSHPSSRPVPTPLSSAVTARRAAPMDRASSPARGAKPSSSAFPISSILRPISPKPL
jgi:hypothetical protein